MRETSRIAYDSIEPDLSELQRRVLQAAKSRSDFIDEDLERELASTMTPQSVRSRRAELVKAGHIRATDEKRRNHRGGLCTVWEVCVPVPVVEEQASLFGDCEPETRFAWED